MVNNKDNRIFVTFKEPLISRIRDAAESADIPLSTTVASIVHQWFKEVDAAKLAAEQAKSDDVLHETSEHLA